MARSLILVGVGSFAGGICRYLTQQFFQKHFPSFIPLGTLSVNILGCLVIGMVYALADRGNVLSPDMRLFLATGICGGYTTFSSFAFENVDLLQNGAFFHFTLYMLLSLVIGLGAVYLGIVIIKLI
ncbi:MAG TPA: fluoride efflux transporter CrcB [Puia sp.]|nr:fluoride efflux transporter CrcB [Puia sp.]